VQQVPLQQRIGASGPMPNGQQAAFGMPQMAWDAEPASRQHDWTAGLMQLPQQHCGLSGGHGLQEWGPQWALSNCLSAQTPSQQRSHVPVQGGASHPPQKFSSTCVFRQMPSHSVNPESHSHLPPKQVRAREQRLPHTPQCLSLSSRLAQVLCPNSSVQHVRPSSQQTALVGALMAPRMQNSRGSSPSHCWQTNSQ
jgi:hypothetical protein